MAWPTKLPYLSGFDQADTVTDQLKDNDKHKCKYESDKKTWPDHKQKKTYVLRLNWIAQPSSLSEVKFVFKVCVKFLSDVLHDNTACRLVV